MKDLLTLRIKNMVCPRCVQAVWNILDKNDVMVDRVELGVAYLQLPLQPEQRDNVTKDLENLGFEILDDRQSILVEKIKNLIHDKFQNLSQQQWNRTFSSELEETLKRDYSTISHLFSSTEGVTIEKYLNQQKIEKVKEFLIYDELSVKEIADLLGFNSTQYLSSKFKQATGMTPNSFKKMNPIHLRNCLSKKV
ncbi:AraC family transcriptional regulator [Flammeovirga sp. SJP92]|uniref:helix-turn-helix domain-containing protein n=1 Tax=Flammeovirga sp. SJP92 TaxID=1775430 RepID=UPI0007C6E2DE|nr:helix-turn-helix transcriptional regulator [Flammeovirga sp. SJP92]